MVGLTFQSYVKTKGENVYKALGAGPAQSKCSINLAIHIFFY